MAYVRTPEHRAEMSASLVGRHLSEEHRAAISLAMRRKRNALGTYRSAEQRSHRSARMEGNQNLRGHRHSEASRERMSASARGNKNALGLKFSEAWKKERSELVRTGPQYAAFRAKRAQPRAVAQRGGLAAHAGRWKRVAYIDRGGRAWALRSGWEARYAQMLDREGLHWTYEPVKIGLSDGRLYIPDFYVEEWCAFVEVKGWSVWGADKVDLARRDGHVVFLVGRSILRSAS